MQDPDDLWKRQPCDDDKSWPVFVEYRDQIPPRKLRPGSDGLTQIRAWYIDNAWRERVAAYDKWRDEIMLEEREDMLRQTSRSVSAEHMRLAKDLRHIAMSEAEKIIESVDKTRMPTVRGIRELTALAEAVVKMDRLVRGETTEKVEVGPDLSKLSVEELQSMHKLLAKTAPPT